MSARSLPTVTTHSLQMLMLRQHLFDIIRYCTWIAKAPEPPSTCSSHQVRPDMSGMEELWWLLHCKTGGKRWAAMSFPKLVMCGPGRSV